MKSKNKKIILALVLLFVVGFVIGVFSDTSLAVGEGYEDENENILLRLLGGALRWIAGKIYNFLGDASIDSLVFNEGGEFSGLTLFKPGDAQNFLAQFYNLFNYIAIALFIPIAYWSGITFTRAGDNPQGKSILKDRLMKIVLTFVLLYTMPNLLTILVDVSNGFTQTFANVGGSANPIGDYITETLELDDVSIIDGITSLMLVGINLWMVFFYIVRDLTICFLFLFFPIVAIWYPLDGGMVKGWWQNMAGNVLSQPIQAVALSLVITMSKSISAPGFLTGLYMIVAFGSIIPMTSIIKGFLGLEGGVGAASSRAGLGGLLGAVSMARMAKRSFDTNSELVKDGVKELAGNKIAKTELDKNINPERAGQSRVEDDYERPLANSTVRASSSQGSMDNGEVTKETLSASNRQAYKKMARGVGSIGTGAFTSLVGASIGGGVGGKEAVALGALGYGMGSIVGGNVASVATDVGIGAKANYQMDADIKDLQNKENVASFMKANPGYEEAPSAEELEGYLQQNPSVVQKSLQTAQEKYLDIYDENLSGTPFQHQQRDAMLQSKRLGNIAKNPVMNFASDLAYASKRAKQYSTEDIAKKEGVQLYQDKDKSYLFVKDTEGQLEVLRTGDGIANMQGSMISKVSFNPTDLGIAEDMSLMFSENAAIDATNYMNTAYPDMTSDDNEYKALYNERYRESSREQTNAYQDNLETARKNMNIENLNIEADEVRMAALVEQSKQRRASTALEEAKRKEAKVKSEKLKNVHAKDFEIPDFEDMSGNLNMNVDSLFNY